MTVESTWTSGEVFGIQGRGGGGDRNEHNINLTDKRAKHLQELKKPTHLDICSWHLQICHFRFDSYFFYLHLTDLKKVWLTIFGKTFKERREVLKERCVLKKKEMEKQLKNAVSTLSTCW